MLKKILFQLSIFHLVFYNFQAQRCGCSDPLAQNYNSRNQLNDGSCSYKNSVLKPQRSFILPNELSESSGLIEYNNYLITHNDDTDTHLYLLEKTSGKLIKKILIPTIKNIDWEAITQDNTHIYIGDFGNNASGTRSNLKIIRIEKSSLEQNPKIDFIHFDYENRPLLKTAQPNATDFDCEAFIIKDDSIYLFTKQWLNEKTSIYSLPITPGNYLAKKQVEYDVKGLITDATYNKKLNLLVLSGYSKTLQPFVFLVYDFKNNLFFSGNVRRIKIALSFHQIEGIYITDDAKLFVSNETFIKKILANNPAQLHIFDLVHFLIQK
jgi:hypothetical protein